MYSLTFCVRVMLAERHQWKPAVQAAAVMLRTPPSTANHQPAVCADPAEHSHYVIISRDGRKLVTRVRFMRYLAVAAQRVHRLQIRPMVHN